jgi:hypothetical protein
VAATVPAPSVHPATSDVQPAQVTTAEARVEVPTSSGRSALAGAATSASAGATASAASDHPPEPSTVSPVDAPVPDPVVPLPTPPAPVSPAPAPAAPTTSASSGSSASGHGSHHYDGLLPVILSSEVDALSAQASGRVDTAAAGAVTGGADNPGSRPD